MSDKRDPETDQPLPKGTGEFVHEEALADLEQWNFDLDVRQAVAEGLRARRELGTRKYGEPLRTGNGRDAVRDAWEEALDMFAYCYQICLEDVWDDNLMCSAKDVLEQLTVMRLSRGEQNG